MSVASRLLLRSLRGQGAVCPGRVLQLRSLSIAPSRVQSVASDSEYATALLSPGLCVSDFTAAWCGPCRFVAPLYEQLAQKHPEVKFLKLDIDTPALAASVSAAGVSAVPTFVFHKGGKVVHEVRGADVEALRAAVSKFA